MRGRLYCNKDYETTIRPQCDGIALLRAIRSIANNDVDVVYKMITINEALINLVTFRQTKHMSLYQYYHRFQIRRDVYEQVGGSVTASPGTITFLMNQLRLTDAKQLTDEQQKEAREMELASLFLLNADQKRYEEILTSLHNDYLCGHDTNPKSVRAAFCLLSNWTSRYNNNDTTANTTTTSNEE
jgi:hypothetical protein